MRKFLKRKIIVDMSPDEKRIEREEAYQARLKKADPRIAKIHERISKIRRHSL